ncbi:alpha-amylase family protein [Propionicicella superfundia]|uniref:alpha-amylase family protein n=1 Tax=Propionicicella superfundia TaxID=348582 RepID=UPI0004240341|nr:alpha-amylase family protein [Propionicicella superfundia]
MTSGRDTIWWHVYPLGFCGAPIRDHDTAPTPRLDHLTGWLDYAVDLGATGLLLGPVFASETHGYDTLDHSRIDPRLGDDAAFDRLVAACRTRGVRLVLDGVFNHVGRHHPWLQQALAGGPAGPDAHIFRIDWSDPAAPRCGTFEGHGELVPFDHSQPRVADAVADVMNHWLDRGADGWRLDAAYAVPAEFWARVLPRVRQHHPDAWLTGEVIHGDYPAYVQASGLDSVTQYELWKAIWSSLADRNLFELDWALTRHNRFLDTFVPTTFVGNHDVTRLASVVGNDRLVAATAILCTVGGTPTIYYGDEQAFRGEKRDGWGGDDEIRPSFPASPADLAGYGWPVFHAHQALLRLRRDRPWLTTARTETVALTNTVYAYRTVSADGARALSVEVDVTSPAHVIVRDGDVVFSS